MLDYDPKKAAAALSKADSKLAKLIARIGPCTLAPLAMHSPFETLSQAIVYQQLSGKAAATIHGRLLALAGTKKLKPDWVISTGDDQLRSVGLSRAKAAAVKDLAAKTLDGTVPTLAKLRRMPDDEVVERLTTVRGIGVWSVEMLLLFRLGRADVLPISDLGVRKGFMIAYRRPEMPTPREVLEYGERWRPFRSVASWYLWRAVDQPVAGNTARQANRK